MTLVQPGQDQLTDVRVARPALRALLRAFLELVLVFVLFQLYRFGRTAAIGDENVAFAHAIDVHRLQEFLHLPSEAAIQAAVGSETLLHLANIYYVSFHFPVMVLFLVWGYLCRPRREYLWARNMIIIQTASALVIHIAFPLAPPRMFPQWGFLDTMRAYGPDAYAGPSAAVANQFAAMPSLHVGWAVLIAYVVARTGPRWLAVLAAGHAVTTAAVVVVTANHWWLDGVVAVALLGVAAAICTRPASARGRRRLVQRTVAEPDLPPPGQDARSTTGFLGGLVGLALGRQPVGARSDE